MGKQNLNHNEIEAKKFFEKHSNAHAMSELNLRPEFSSDLKEKLYSTRINNLSKSDNQSMRDRFSSVFNNHRSIFVAGSVAFGLLALVVLFSSFIDADTTSKNDEIANDTQPVKKITATIAMIEGDIQYKESGSDVWWEAKSDTDITEGSVIKTAEASKATVEFENGTIVRISSDSEVKIASLNPEKMAIDEVKGQVYARISDEKSSFETKTPDASYKSKVSAYRVTNTESTKGVESYYMDVVASKVSDKVEKVVKQGNQYYFMKDSQETSEEVSPINIDELRKDEFVNWNRNEDMTKGYEGEDLGSVKDFEVPAITIVSPENKTTTLAATIEIKGTTEVDAKIKVNGEEVANNAGEFSKEVSLEYGENKFIVESTDVAGNMSKVTVIVSRNKPAEPAPPTPVTKNITITQAVGGPGAIKVFWSLPAGFEAKDGYKMLYGPTANLTYPGSQYVYVSDSSVLKAVATGLAPGTYYVRVCRYVNGGCDSYSGYSTVVVENK